MNGVESGAELSGDFDRLVGGKSADATQERREIVAVNKLHREKVRAFHFSDVENATDVRVRDPARRADFAVKPFERRFVPGEIFRQELERDRLIKLEVFGFIDLAHSAPA
jgi:hypothetical protein